MRPAVVARSLWRSTDHQAISALCLGIELLEDLDPERGRVTGLARMVELLLQSPGIASAGELIPER